jgi:hypothetical protein
MNDPNSEATLLHEQDLAKELERRSAQRQRSKGERKTESYKRVSLSAVFSLYIHIHVRIPFLLLKLYES